MKLYRCNLTLQDYLFFATTERGKVAETGPFIHNYALTYAMGWAVSPWHNEIQKPNYREELAAVGKRYITPAKLIRGSTAVSQYNTMSESFGIGKKEQSIGYPDWGFIKCFCPGAVFQCYVISAGDLHFPPYIRLGKFMAKTKLHITMAQEIRQIIEPIGARKIQRDAPLLAWDDLAKAARPIVFDIIVNALPGKLIANAVFDGIAGSYLQATFADEATPILIPLHMGYYGANVCASW